MKLQPKQQALIFIFGGRSEYWPGMGSELYQNEPVFRECIQKCDELIVAAGEESIIANFQKKEGAFILTGESTIVTTITALQIALFELWKSKGIIPTAVVGISLGEAAASYAAGAINLKDTVLLSVDASRINKFLSEDFVTIYARTSLLEGRQYCLRSKQFARVIYEISANEVLISCSSDDGEAVNAFLQGHGVESHLNKQYRTWPYHTELLSKYEEQLSFHSQFVREMPLQCDYYSSNHGRLVSKGEIISNSFWFNSRRTPVLAHSTLQALPGKYPSSILVHIGPHPFLKKQTIASASASESNTVMLDSMQRNIPEWKQFSSVLKQLQSVRIAPSSLATINRFEDFKNNFSFLDEAVNTNPFPYLRYFQENGKLHYLPRHQCWLVVDYDLIDEMLKNPQIFSSSALNSFDQFLLGADPPSHTAMRALMQPLFSPAVITALGEFTNKKSADLCEKLPSEIPFNFVDEFSLPLTRAVVAQFLGLTEIDAETLRNSNGSHIYALQYFDELLGFCQGYLQDYDRSRIDTPVAALLRLVDEEKLPAEGAARMMRMLWVAGMTTTSMLISSAVYMLAKDPELRNELQSNDRLIPKFIEECLRLETPESETVRMITSDFSADGQTIPAGSFVMLSFRAANRDPQLFQAPEKIILDRPAKFNFSFGGGAHYCLGVAMARTEARQAIKTILENIDEFELEPEGTHYFSSPHFRGLETLMLSRKSST